jgi:hypothetical protein
MCRNMMFDRDYGDFLNRMEDITDRNHLHTPPLTLKL